MKTLKKYLSESILDPIHKKLNPTIWDKNEKVKPSVKIHILKRAELWLKNYTNKPIEQAYFLGSNTSYQYNDTSDIDINIIVKITDEELKKLTKLLPNGQLLPQTNHPINYYISNKKKKEWEKAGSIYDLLKNKWIRKSKKEERSSIVSNYKAVVEIARFFITGLNAVVSEYERDVADYETYKSYLNNAKEEEKNEIKRLMNFKLQEILADIDSIGIADKLIHSFRKEAFAEKGAFDTKIDIVGKTANESVNNLIYKYLERLSYFSKIRDIKDKSAKWEKLTEE